MLIKLITSVYNIITSNGINTVFMVRKQDHVIRNFKWFYTETFI